MPLLNMGFSSPHVSLFIDQMHIWVSGCPVNMLGMTCLLCTVILKSLDKSLLSGMAKQQKNWQDVCCTDGAAGGAYCPSIIWHSGH